MSQWISCEVREEEGVDGKVSGLRTVLACTETGKAARTSRFGEEMEISGQKC